MASAFSTWAANGILNALLNNTAFQVAQAWASLHSGDTGLTQGGCDHGRHRDR